MMGEITHFALQSLKEISKYIIHFTVVLCWSKSWLYTVREKNILSVLKNFLMRRGYLGLSRKKSWDEEENYMLRRFII